PSAYKKGSVRRHPARASPGRAFSISPRLIDAHPQPATASTRVAPVWSVAGLVFASGFCALVYQIAWQREFRLVFGATTAASAAVLAVFMGGLGLGGLWLGKRADRHAQPLRLYALLEALVALTAAATPPLLQLVRTA